MAQNEDMNKLIEYIYDYNRITVDKEDFISYISKANKKVLNINRVKRRIQHRMNNASIKSNSELPLKKSILPSKL